MDETARVRAPQKLLPENGKNFRPLGNAPRIASTFGRALAGRKIKATTRNDSWHCFPGKGLRPPAADNSHKRVCNTSGGQSFGSMTPPSWMIRQPGTAAWKRSNARADT